MTIDQAVGAWEAMELEANDSSSAVGRRRAGISLAVVFTRTAVMVAIAAGAILVVLPALLSAQAAVVV